MEEPPNPQREEEGGERRKVRKRTMTTGIRKRTLRMKRRRMRTVSLRLQGGHHSTPDLLGMETPWTQASVGPEVPCPSSHPQDL